jgi:diguanylate cyclase (GGDEF)-like protein
MTWWEYWLSLVLVMAAAGLALVAVFNRRYAWLGVVPSALLLLAAVAFLRDSGGGSQSGGGALAILPVFQTALYSRSRRDLGIVLAGLVFLFLVPIWVVGSPGYPAAQYRTVLLAVSADAIIGLTTQVLVTRVREQSRESRLRQKMLEQVSAVVHGLFESDRPRRDVCEAAIDISSASSAVLYEPIDDSGQLVCVAMAGVSPEVSEFEVQRRSAAYEVMRTGQPILITENVEATIGLIDAWLAGGRPTSLLYQPLLRGRAVVGVLIVGWSGRVRAEGTRTAAIALLGHEAAVAISRADTLDSLSDETLTDPLTGLPNRRAWERQLRALDLDRRPLAVAILDLDHFKQFNDTYGHPAGDRLLKETAAAWRDQIRDGDMLARVGGEEFGVLLRDCGAEKAIEVIERLREHVADGRTCSAGIAIKEIGETTEHTVERADVALYQAKASGRDHYAMATGK